MSSMTLKTFDVSAASKIYLRSHTRCDSDDITKKVQPSFYQQSQPNKEGTVFRIQTAINSEMFLTALNDRKVKVLPFNEHNKGQLWTRVDEGPIYHPKESKSLRVVYDMIAIKNVLTKTVLHADKITNEVTLQAYIGSSSQAWVIGPYMHDYGFILLQGTHFQKSLGFTDDGHIVLLPDWKTHVEPKEYKWRTWFFIPI